MIDNFYTIWYTSRRKNTHVFLCHLAGKAADDFVKVSGN